MPKPAILCVANWDSNVGYAWWLMESFWVEIAKHYHNKYEVILVYPSISKIPENINSSSLKVYEKDFTFSSSLSLLEQIQFLIKNKIKYIYFSDRPNKNWRYLFYRLAGIKIIISHDHTPGNRTIPHAIKKYLKSAINRVPFITTNASIGATEFVKQRLIEVNCIPEKRCYAASNGIPALNYEEKTKLNLVKFFNIPQDRDIIVLVGRASLYKGFDFALEASRVLIHDLNYKKVHVLFLGDGPALKYFQKMVNELKIADYVTFAGRVNTVDKILRSCSIAFNPSKGEVGYSLSILEYMRAYLPIVVSDNPSVCGATENGIDGIIYKQGDVYAAAAALHALLINPDLVEKMGNAGANKVSTIYSHETCLRVLMNIFDEVFKKYE